MFYCGRLYIIRSKMNKPFYGVASMPLAGRSNFITNVDIPGPGSYDASRDKSRNDLPKWSLKKRYDQGSCFENLSITPGPGKYQSEEGFKKEQELIISSKGEKFRNYAEKSYPHSPIHLPGAINLKGGYSFGYREQQRQLEKSPGPVYHLDIVTEEKRAEKNTSRLNGFGCEKKNVIKCESTPGPGAFNPWKKDEWVSKTCENWTFGTSKRSGSLPSTEIGPGDYDPKFLPMHNRSFKLRGRNQPKIYYPSALGPGAYNIPDTKTKQGTKFNSPKQDHQHQQQDKPEQNISPCSYDPPRYLDQPTGHGFSLGMKIQQNLNGSVEEPGPGTYEIASSYNKGQGGYMGRKVEPKKKENISMDNFYKYDPNLNTVARQSPKFSFPQGRKGEKQNRSGYSQQFYQSLDSKGGYSYSMGTSKRFADLKKQKGPFKDRQVDCSTIGQMPSYLRKSSKRR